jgi:cysteinyl-tRNA synthetase
MAALGCLPPDHQPRATEHVPGMIAMIEQLIARGAAYAAEGHVLFEVAKFPDYGRLSGRSVDDMIAGARVEVAPYKRDPMDFVLWKPSAEDQPGWSSPWGRGRPGWHIECSAMSRALLGADFDIHGGGADLMFPHHENEIAQSRCAHPDEGFAGLWMHNGMIRVDGEKMSKSAGNFITLEDARVSGLEGYQIRLMILMTGYRDTLDWTDNRKHEAQVYLRRWRRAMDEGYEFRREMQDEITSITSIEETLCDDLDTVGAVRIVDKCARLIGDDTFPREIRNVAEQIFRKGIDLLGFGEMLSESFAGNDPDYMEVFLRQSERRINRVVDILQRARSQKDWVRADSIRDKMKAAGLIVSIGKNGVKTEITPQFDSLLLDDIQ